MLRAMVVKAIDDFDDTHNCEVMVRAK